MAGADLCSTIKEYRAASVEGKDSGSVLRHLFLLPLNINDIIVKMNTNLIFEDYTYELIQKDRYSGTTSGSFTPEDLSQFETFLKLENHPTMLDLRSQLFENDGQALEIGQKVSQRSLSWLMTICWSKDLSCQCLWTAVLLFYALRIQNKIKKEQLQITLIACLWLSSKLYGQGLTLKQVQALSAKGVQRADLIEMEGFVLQQVNYNIVIPHYIPLLLKNSFLTEQQKSKMEFIIELFMIKNHKIFFDAVQLQTLGKIFQDGINANSFLQYKELKEQIKELLALKQCSIVLNKFSSKFEIQSITSLFL